MLGIPTFASSHPPAPSIPEPSASELFLRDFYSEPLKRELYSLDPIAAYARATKALDTVNDKWRKSNIKAHISLTKPQTLNDLILATQDYLRHIMLGVLEMHSLREEEMKNNLAPASEWINTFDAEAARRDTERMIERSRRADIDRRKSALTPIHRKRALEEAGQHEQEVLLAQERLKHSTNDAPASSNDDGGYAASLLRDHQTIAQTNQSASSNQAMEVSGQSDSYLMSELNIPSLSSNSHKRARVASYAQIERRILLEDLIASMESDPYLKRSSFLQKAYQYINAQPNINSKFIRLSIAQTPNNNTNPSNHSIINPSPPSITNNSMNSINAPQSLYPRVPLFQNPAEASTVDAFTNHVNSSNYSINNVNQINVPSL